ncbi:MAG TPA: inorganic phosphate transporter [Euryarchaeota archaeon]|nr:inorganic phosphate transporter [Euryarchaeota archaeon]
MIELFLVSGITLFAIMLTWIFDFVNGFHDSANSIATIVATKVLTPVKAVGLAAFFNFLGILYVSEVAMTIKKGIIREELIIEYGIPIVLSTLLGAIIWDLITWWFGIPTSSSHALVGGLLGSGGAAAGLGAVVWSGTMKTSIFIIISPLAGLIIGFFIVAMVMRAAKNSKRAIANKWFRRLQLASSAFYSFTHGTNDAQKGMGIIMLILLADPLTTALVLQHDGVFLWVAVSCHAAIALGTFFGGWRIVKTMASRITKLEPYQGFSAETGAASILAVTAFFGIPVSTTHTISGSIMGVGAARRLSAVRWGVGRRIVVAWILTIPAAATISGLIFLGYLHLLY